MPDNYDWASYEREIAMTDSKNTENKNPLKLCGIEFTEYATPDSDFMEKAFFGFGFSKTKKMKGRDVEYFNQNDIHFHISCLKPMLFEINLENTQIKSANACKRDKILHRKHKFS